VLNRSFQDKLDHPLTRLKRVLGRQDEVRDTLDYVAAGSSDLSVPQMGTSMHRISLDEHLAVDY
jgi:hypothetical protein